MNVYLKRFLHRGMLFGGFGPIVAGIIYAVLGGTLSDFSLGGTEVCLAIISTYMLAFVQAGASVFNQIESWPITKSLLCHFSLIYAAYTLCYLINTWIPFKWEVVAVFTAIFVVVYLVIWVSVYLTVRSLGGRLNRQLGQR